MELYGRTPEQYMVMDLTSLQPQDLKELAYYLWCCFEDDKVLMEWREKVLLPFVQMSCPAEPEPVEEEEEEDV